MARKKGVKLKNIKHEKFCEHYVSEEFFGSGVASYAEAYGYSLEDPKQYNVCKTRACVLLKSKLILRRINELLEHAHLSDGFVDREMAFVIAQKTDLHAKMKGIAEYNKIRKRIDAGLKLEFPGIAKIVIKNPGKCKKKK